MMKKPLKKAIFLCAAFCLGANFVAADSVAEAFSPIKLISPNSNVSPSSELNIRLSKQSGIEKNIKLSKNDSFYNLANATDRFVQCNTRIAWEDFKNYIDNIEDNDFLYLSIANNMADLGFFDLSLLAVAKIKDKELTNVSIDAMKRFYYPRKKLRLEDELFLAGAYSNIYFNNQASEATNELLKKENLLINYDYANYLVALGAYKSNSYTKAAKYINIAILQNPSNLNYQKLKAEILAENGEAQDALKIVDNLKKQNLYSYEYEQKIKSLEQFILYKIKKAQWEKDYHLGYYHYIENDPSKAIRTLQNALSYKKRANASLVYGLMSEIYFNMNEFEKASDTAKKSHKINSNNPKALLTMGKLEYKNGNYKQALNYCKKASFNDKKAYEPLIEQAKVYQKLTNVKKANEIYTKILKTHSDCWEAYYNVALMDKNKRVVYLKKALAVNPLFTDGWIELAKTEIEKGEYEIAQKYLANAFYIDENDFRYYYYQGLVNNNSGDYAQAKYNFKKCLKLNSGFKDAQQALDLILKNENNIFVQDNI